MAASIDAASGLLWQDGCAGPKVTRGFFNLSDVEANFPAWQRADADWAARAARGSGRPRRAEGHPDGLLLQRRVHAVRPDLGRAVRAERAVPEVHRRRSSATRSRHLRPVRDRAAVRPASRPGAGPDAAGRSTRRKPTPDPEAALELDDRRPVAAFATLAGAHRLDQRMVRGRGAGRRRAAAPVPSPWMIEHLVEPGQRRVVEVAGQRLERLVDPRAAQVERRRDGPGALEAERRDVRGRAAPRAVAGAIRAPSSPSAGTRSSTSTVTRIPPASSVARRPPRSSAAIRPSQPPDRLRARSPSCHVAVDRDGSTARRVLGLGQALERRPRRGPPRRRGAAR